MIAPELLHRLAPRVDAAIVAEALNRAADKYDINTTLRVCHWLAQMAEESLFFTVLEENLNYSAQGLLTTWPARFTPEEAEFYSHKPALIASHAYADRMGNGDEKSQDGWKYRGRGYLMITGKSGYIRAKEVSGLDLVDNPDQLVAPEIAALVAGAFWQENGCNALADKDDVVAITERINGGTLGLVRREAMLKVVKGIFNG